MGKKILLFILINITLFGCSDDYLNTRSLEYSEGLSIWWSHKFFGENGRGYLFAFSEVLRQENSYDLEFEYKIDSKRKEIKVYLTGKVDKGLCPVFPSPNPTDGLCLSDGNIFIPENSLTIGTYDFIIHTKDYTARSVLKVEHNRTTLEIQDNEYIRASVTEVFPSPKNLLYGTIAYHGIEQAVESQQYLLKLEEAGFEKTIVSNPPFNLDVDENGQPKLHFVEPDRYYQSFLFQLNESFSYVCQLTTNYFEQNSIDIHLFTTNGDQGHFSKRNGITIVYTQN